MTVGLLYAWLLIGVLEMCLATSPHANDDAAPRSFLSKSESRKPKLKTLQYENCGSASDPGKILELKINQQEDGDVVVTASGSTDIEIKPPMKVVVKMSKKTAGVWMDVPCIKKVFGSCTIPDLCHYGMDECPFKTLKESNIPCHCPIKKGTYGVKMVELPVAKTTMNGLLAGTYKARFETFNADNTRFSCYNFTVAIS